MLAAYPINRYFSVFQRVFQNAAIAFDLAILRICFVKRNTIENHLALVYLANRNLASPSQKPPQQLHAWPRQKTLGVKLPPLQLRRLVPHTHDLAARPEVAPSTGDQTIGQRRRVDHQTVITRGHKRRLDPLEQSAVIVADQIGFAVHQHRRTNDRRPKCLADRLVPQTDTQDRNLAHKVFDTFDTDPRFAGRTGTGRDQQPRRAERFDLLWRDLVVAKHPKVDRRIDLAHPLDQVVSERIVVIDDDDHGMAERKKRRVQVLAVSMT